MSLEFDEALAKFIADCQGLIDEYWVKSGYDKSPWMNKPIIQVHNSGARYVRLATYEDGQRHSVYVFIDKTNGDVLKGSWKAPVKNGVRGNIFSGKPVSDYMTNYGPKYLR